MARNTGNGFRIGALLDRSQMLNPATGLYTVVRASTGKILRNKKSPGPAKGDHSEAAQEVLVLTVAKVPVGDAPEPAFRGIARVHILGAPHRW